MILDLATPEQIKAGQIISGVAMAGMLGAGLFGRYARIVRIGFAATYIAAVLAFIAWSLL
jgi:hypothetical protein